MDFIPFKPSGFPEPSPPGESVQRKCTAMSKHKTLTASLLIAVLLIALALTAACSKAGDAEQKLVVGVSPSPHAEILRQVVDDLKKEGVELVVREYSDYVLPNRDLADGEIDANYFQHLPYFEEFIARENLDLISLGGIHIEPMGIYSAKHQSLEDLPEGAEVMIPNDTTNCGRALLLLQKQGLIKLSVQDVSATEKDVVENPKQLKFTALEAAAIPLVYKDADLAVINGNYAIQHELNPLKDALKLEDAESPFVNIIAIRRKDRDDQRFEKLMKALQSEKIQNFILEKYEGSVIPAFTDADGKTVALEK